jgi:hypothetical protein
MTDEQQRAYTDKLEEKVLALSMELMLIVNNDSASKHQQDGDGEVTPNESSAEYVDAADRSNAMQEELRLRRETEERGR